MKYASLDPVVIVHLASDTDPAMISCADMLMPDYSQVPAGRHLASCPLCVHFARLSAKT